MAACSWGRYKNETLVIDAPGGAADHNDQLCECANQSGAKTQQEWIHTHRADFISKPVSVPNYLYS